MAKKALIHGTRICQIVEDGEEFPVAPELKWVDVADGTVADQDTWVDDKVVKYSTPTLDYTVKRKGAYGLIEDQLDMIYWDQVNSTTTFKDHIAKVKSDIPKE